MTSLIRTNKDSLRTLSVLVFGIVALTGSFLASPQIAFARIYDPGFLPCAIGDRSFTDESGKHMCDTEGDASEGDTFLEQVADSAEQVVDGIGDGIVTGALALILGPIAVVSFVILAIASGLLWLAGVIFNWSVEILVFQFATYLGNTPGMLLAWGILRDFGNIILLFGFVYMGIQTILQIGHYSVGRALSRLVIFAVLLNFSLFIAEAVIDTSNVLASTLYTQSYASTGTGQACQGRLQECQINDGIASVILARSGVASVFEANDNGFSELIHYATNPVGKTLQYLMMAILVTAAAVVLFAGAFLLISRAVHLAFLMVSSPIGFAGMAVPWLEKIAKDWWDQLIKQAMFAPVFLILLFVGLKLTEGLDTVLGSDVAGAFSANNSISTGPIILFVLIIGFLIGALLAAKQFGVYGAEAITKTATGIIGRTAGAATFGSMGWLGRRTIGSASTAVGRSLRGGVLQNIGKTAIVGRQLTALADAGAKASFDGRSSLKTGVELGGPSTAAKGGRLGELEATRKANEEHDKSITDEDKKKHDLLSAEKTALREKIDEALGTEELTQTQLFADARVSARFGPEVQKMQELDTQMGKTVTGKTKKEAEKKEDLDKDVQTWNTNATRLETIANRLQSIDRDLRDQRFSDPASQQRLNTQRGEFETERQDLERQQGELQTSVVTLADSIRLLRRDIKKQGTQYRRSMQSAAKPNIAGFSPLDRRALKEAVVSVMDKETKFKPKNLNEALGRGLRNKLNIPHP